jgi:tungstate transport system permease protein
VDPAAGISARESFGQEIPLSGELAEIVRLTLQVSAVALLISVLMGVPTGAALGLARFRGRRIVVVLIYTGMGFPPVVVGLVVYLFLSHNGPFGWLDWPWLPSLFTPGAMVLAQSIIALPLIVGITMAAMMGVDPQLRLQLRSLGATPRQLAAALLLEARAGVIVAVIAGFGGIISEVGAAMLVGGNIEGRTRVLTTAIVLETRRGNFDLAVALGLILIGLTFVANMVMYQLQGNRVVE